MCCENTENLTSSPVHKDNLLKLSWKKTLLFISQVKSLFLKGTAARGGCLIISAFQELIETMIEWYFFDSTTFLALL